MKVKIDGIKYIPEGELNKQAMNILADVYGALWAEAYYDPYNDSTKKFAAPLADKMHEANKILGFKE